MLDFGTIVPTSFMTAHIKVTKRMRANWKYMRDIKTGNGIISKDHIKQTKTLIICTVEYKQVAIKI